MTPAGDGLDPGRSSSRCLALTGALTLFGGGWVFVVHDVAGLALGGVLVWKLRRVWRRVLTRRLGLIAALFVAGTLATGYAWSTRDPPDRVRLQPAQSAHRARRGC